MTLRHLKIFVCVYQNLSITKASKELHLAQPSVSLAIKELETYYGLHLFDRISKRLYITESGKHFYDYALHIVSLFQEMEKEIHNLDSLSPIKIGSSITIGTFLLPSFIEQFKLLHPNISVTVTVNNSSIIETYILDNQVDFALVENSSSHSQIRQIPFCDDRLCFICGANHPLAHKKTIAAIDLASCDFLLREQGSAGRDIFESIMTLYHIHIVPVWESVSTQAILEAVSHGLGVSVLPYLFVKQYLKSGLVVEKQIEGVSLERKFFLIYHQNKYLSGSAKDFISLCIPAIFKKELEEGGIH